MNEYMGDFLFDTFQPFHFYIDEHTDYCIPEELDLKEDIIGMRWFFLINSTSTFDRIYYELHYPSMFEYNILLLNWNAKIFNHFYFLFHSIEHIDQLPMINKPDVFGLHPNAEIGYYTQATKGIWSSLIELQPQTGELVGYFWILFLPATSLLFT